MAGFVMGATVNLSNNFSGAMSAMTSDTEKFKATAESADRAVDNLEKNLHGINGKGLSAMGTSATQAATAVNSVVAPIDNIVQSTNRAQNAIQSFNRGWQSIKALPSTLSNIGSTLKSNVADGFTSARLQASILAATVKTLGKQKLDGMVSGVKEFTKTITEGKSGIKGFATGLKNIGKISIAGTVNAVKNLTKSAKDFAKVKISNMANQLKTLKSSFTSGKSGASALHTALKKVASVSMNTLHSGIKKVGDLAKSAGAAVSNGLGKALKATAKGAGIAAAAGATAVVALVKQSVDSFGSYEQLVGGVETLFGAGGQSLEEYAKGIGKSVDSASGEYNRLMASQQAVFDNADIAYRTAGLSANDYMETVTSFSASLLQSLGGDTQKAAGVADKAIIDMADNANKMGTSMDMIQNAYQGFAKQNYTMLDNLKLGYGGTKTEMERLLKDAGKIAKQKFNINSYADVIEAIHVMQTEMGITGTTADEASTTIQGSAASMKAAWGNMLTAFVTGGDSFNTAFDNLMSSAATFGKNIMPVIEKALIGIGTAIEKAAPVIAEKLPSIISSLLPSLVKATGSLVGAVVKALPSIVASLIPAVKSAAGEIVKALYEGLTGKEMSADTFKSVENAINKIVSVCKYAVPAVLGLVAAFKAFKVVQSISSVLSPLISKLTKFKGTSQTVSDTVSSSSSKMAQSAKSYMMLGAAALMIAGSFALLAFSAISLANAGGGAIAVMAGLVAALVGLGFGMTAALKSVSQLGPQAMTGATAMLMLGAAVVLVGVGFALMAQSAIALSNAGGGAIAVMAGLVVAIAGLAIGAALLGSALTAGAVGFLAFGAAIVLAGAGAVLFAAAVNLMTPPLLALIPVVGSVVNTIVNSIGSILVNCIQTAGTAISTILQSVGDIFIKFGEGVSTIVTAIGGAISGVLDSVANIFNSIGTAALNAGTGFERVANGLKTISAIPLTSLIKSLGAVGEGLSTMSKYGESVAQVGLGMQQTATAILLIGVASTQASAAITTLCSVLSTLTIPTIDTTSFAASFDSLASSVTAGTASINAALSSLDVSGATAKCAELITAFTEGMANANTAVAEGVAAIQSTLNAVNLYSCGVNIMSGLNNGLLSMRGTIIATAQSIANSVKSTINSALDIHSPSRVLEDSGENTGLGFANGLLNLINQVKANATQLADTAVEPFSVKHTMTDIAPSGMTTAKEKVLGGLKVIIENLNLNDVGNKDAKQLISELLKELYAQLGGDDEILGNVDLGVLL